MSEQTAPAFNVQKIFLKDMSFESPNSPETFRKQWKPEVKMDMKSANKDLGNDNFEVVLTLTINTKVEDTVAFLVEVQQAGIFSIKNFSDDQKKHALNAYCQNVLFPYAREAIDNVVVKGGFPALMLAPINFDAIYQQAQAKQAAAAKEKESANVQ